MSRHRLIPPGHRLVVPVLAVAAYALAFVQRPGKVVADTRVDLYADPARLLGRLVSAWSSTGDLGHVWGARGGLLFPMAPWFALGDRLGVATWVVQRLWLGTLLALAAWGVVRMMQTLWARDAGVPHVAAAVLFVANPYVALSLNRTSVALLAYVALPWLLLAVERGVRDPRGWRWPAGLALILAAAGGGPDLAAIGWMLIGPLLLVLYDLRWGGLSPRALVPYGWRLLAALVAASAWWVVPVLVDARNGSGTQQLRGVVSLPSLSESLRLAGVLHPAAGWQDLLLDNRVVVVAGLLVPALALAGLRWTRTMRYGPFFAALVMTGAVITTAARSAYPAGALVALGTAVLAGGALAAAQARLPWRRHRLVLAGAGLALCAAAAWPLVTGRAPERRLELVLSPGLRALAADLDRGPDTSRALVEPGGRTGDALAALSRRSVSVGSAGQQSGRRAAELQRGVHELLAGARARPDQLRSLLELMAVGDIVFDNYGGEGTLAATAALVPQFGTPATRYGSARVVQPAPGAVGPPQRLPELQRVEIGTQGLVRLLPRGPAVIVDGGERALVALAGFGDLPGDRPIRYAADMRPEQLRAAAQAGATVVTQGAGSATDTLRDANLDRTPLEELLARDPGASQIAQVVAPPAARRWTAQAWARADAAAPDAALDRLAGTSGAGVAAGSQRFQNRPGFRASSAFDGDPSTAWVARWRPGRPVFLAWSVQRSISVRRLRFVAAPFITRIPTLVALNGHRARVGADGTATFAPAVRATRFRLDILRAVFPGGTPRHVRDRRAAVAIGELAGAGLRLAVPRAGALRAPCGSAAVGAAGAVLALRVTGDRGDFDAGRPLSATGCGSLALPAGRTEVRGLPRGLVLDELRLVAPPPNGIVLPGQSGTVLRQGSGEGGRRVGVRLSVDGTSWLVFGVSYNRGWRARCDGRDLGPPTPIGGYANGWLVRPGCSAVDFRFAPDDTLRLAYLVSIFGIPFLVFAVARRRRPGYTNLTPLAPTDGVTDRLIDVAGGLLVIGVPAVYLLAPWGRDHPPAQWVAVAALAALVVALVRTLRRAGAPSPKPSAS